MFEDDHLSHVRRCRVRCVSCRGAHLWHHAGEQGSKAGSDSLSALRVIFDFILKVHMRLSRFIFAAVVPLVASAQSPAQQHILTLQDAIAMAQNQGPSAQVARSTRDGARDRNDAFRARLLPQLVLSGTAANLNHGINPITLPDGSTQFIGQAQNQSSFSIGFSQQIPLTGGTVSVSSAVSRIDQFGALNGRYYPDVTLHC